MRNNSQHTSPKVRESKSSTQSKKHNDKSHHLAGARIEILATELFVKCYTIAPSMGARIEIKNKLLKRL